jgi:hypothetical protein
MGATTGTKIGPRNETAIPVPQTKRNKFCGLADARYPIREISWVVMSDVCHSEEVVDR